MDDSPQDMDVGASGNEGVWPGMSIKDILEKVDLFNVTTLEEEDDIFKTKDAKPPTISRTGVKEPKKVVCSASKPESAFLGPKIWKNPITLPMLSGSAGGNGDAEFSIMNIDDFLTENNFDLNRISPPLPDEEILGLGKEANKNMMMRTPKTELDGSDSSQQKSGRNLLPKGENSFLYAESKRAKIERERAEMKRKMEVELEFSPEELALATIPGADFDPKRRHFSPEELRPQPIIRKRKKTLVCNDEKDGKYWEKRTKNNLAARRSREARRLKENQIALRTAYLEQENAALQAALDKSADDNQRLTRENEQLKEALERYETGILSLN